MDMKAGDLRHRITIQKLSGAVDEMKQPIPDDWVDVATRSASVEPLTGREYWAAQQVQAETTVRIRMRYLRGIDPTMRVLFKGRVLEIIAPPVNVGEKNIELQLLCKEVS